MVDTIHRPAAQIHKEHGRFVLQKPYFGHEGGIALWEDSNFFDGDAVLHALELVVQRLIAPQQIIFELGFVASETRQRQTRRNAHRTFGRQAALPDFFCNRCQRQQVVVVVYGLVTLDFRIELFQSFLNLSRGQISLRTYQFFQPCLDFLNLFAAIALTYSVSGEVSSMLFRISQAFWFCFMLSSRMT